MASDRAALTKQVKEASDLVAVVGAYLPLQAQGNVFKGVCPFHNDTRPSMQVDPKWQNFHCWACGKKGDVFTFVEEMEKVAFPEAVEILARRAGILLEGAPGQNAGRVRMLEAMRWAAGKYQECLLDSDSAGSARIYLGQRKLSGATVRNFGLGFAPISGDWLVRLARAEAIDLETLREVGLIAPRDQNAGFYDRFRDRVMFPIRDVRGQTVGFGGRILPNSPLGSRPPKYYNSSDTPLFNKSELLFGLDQARSAGASEGYLAVVEGYTDVMMAHQAGLPHVVATMGTALNARHVRQLRRYVPRVVLVFDADAGGLTGIDRALEIFVAEDVELQVATLPEGLDPCDLIVAQGAEPFRRALASAVDALDFKLNRLLSRESNNGLEGTRRTVDGVLALLAMTPTMTGNAGRVKRELMVTRIAHRLGLRQETVWARLGELQSERRPSEPIQSAGPSPDVTPAAPASGPAPSEERELLEVLLADPGLVPVAIPQVRPEQITHAGLRRLLDGLYGLHRDGEPPDLDGLRVRIDSPVLAAKALDLQMVGRTNPDRSAWLQRIVEVFRRKTEEVERKKLRSELQSASDHDAAIDMLRRLQGGGSVGSN